MKRRLWTKEEFINNREVKTRVNQNIFRLMILANYNQQCALTGIDLPELLLASHIKHWSSCKEERLNPENGICLSALYNKSFDQGLIGFDSNYYVLLSSRIEEKRVRSIMPITPSQLKAKN